MSAFTDVVATVPPGEIGIARIVHDSPDEFTRLRAAIKGMLLDQSKFVRLFVGDTLMMTDARFERISNLTVIDRAKGKALVAGLGIGLILKPLIKACSSVTIIEKHADVISLVGPRFPECTVIHSDIFDWTPAKGTKYDTIYFDIWPDICTDDLDEAQQLHRKFRKYLAKDGWMGSWTTVANKLMRRR